MCKLKHGYNYYFYILLNKINNYLYYLISYTIVNYWISIDWKRKIIINFVLFAILISKLLKILIQ